MRALILSTLVGVVAAQMTVDPATLNNIFSTAPTTTTALPLEKVTIKPTDTPTEFVDVDGDACKCLPYYLCDKDNNGVNANNASLTGWGTLDISYRGDECSESVLVCCKIPNAKTEEEAVTPAPLPIDRGCGYRNPKGLDFAFDWITGSPGNEAQFGEFPWMVAIMNAFNDSYVGGGVLLHPRVVMTGAHIAYKYEPKDIKIRAGEWDTQTVKERLKHQERLVQEIYIHSEFKVRTLRNDFALLLLREPVELSSHINVICMPEQDEDFSKYKGCIVNGWGKAQFGVLGRYAVILKRVEIDMVPNPKCNEQLKKTRLGKHFNLHDSFVCAGGEEGKDTCQGDGGAPLACPIGDDRYKLTGIVAWGIGCGQKDVPAVYAAVARVREWVDDQMTAWGLGTSDYKI